MPALPHWREEEMVRRMRTRQAEADALSLRTEARRLLHDKVKRDNMEKKQREAQKRALGEAKNEIVSQNHFQEVSSELGAATAVPTSTTASPVVAPSFLFLRLPSPFGIFYPVSGLPDYDVY